MAENLAASESAQVVPHDCWPGIAALVLIVGTLLLAVPQRPPPDSIAPEPNAAAPAQHASAKRAGHWPVPRAVRSLADQVLASADNEARPFVIVDKRHARVHAVGADGRLIGSTPVLLGAARGDDSVPGIGERPIRLIQPFERTTPAGRFVAAAGVNTRGEDIVWVDYDAAVSMHRVRVVDPKERRLQRLASPSAADNRISYGCINVPVGFYDDVIAPMFRGGEHAVYVLPEVKPVHQVFAFGRGTPVATGRHEHQARSGD